MNRRDFLRRSLLAAIGSGAICGPLGSLRLAHAAATSKALADYKALVCVFLAGGNDSFNTIVPRDATTYDTYSQSRGGNLVIARSVAQQNPLTPLAAPIGGGDYGLHAGMDGLRSLFNSGQCAIVANVGPLTYPITKAQLEAGSVPTPPQLFSHSDQTLCWETSWPDSVERSGWGGRIADLMLSANENAQVSPCISLAGANTLQVGRNVQPYFLGPYGSESVFFIRDEWQQNRSASFEALRQLAAADGSHVFERAYAGIMKRAIDTHALVETALGATAEPTATFPDTWLGAQLRMASRMIAARQQLGMSRQIFFVTAHGYDTHDNQLEAHAALLAELSTALSAFYQETVNLGVASNVTTFTASEFGRTVSVNGDGTDHGWGGHHFVIGGAVQGQRFYGQMPDLTFQGQDDAGWGQIIPTTAVDQYVATLARWFGVSDSDIADIVTPNIGRFASADLGFMG